ncbi:MAG: hypothetical protein AAF202_08660 [Pseudomonadota bacterium]
MEDKTRFLIAEIVSSLVHDVNNSLSMLSFRIDEEEDAADNPNPETIRRLHVQLKEALGKVTEKINEISRSHLRAERDMIKPWSNQAKEKNKQEPQDSNVVWRVRGNPKSGFMLRKFAKVLPTEQ